MSDMKSEITSTTLKVSIAALALLSMYGYAQDSAPNLPVLRAPISSLDSQEGIIADINIPAGAEMPKHKHPGDEFLYMIAGTVELERDGLPVKILTAGDAFQIPAGLAHRPKAGANGARAIVFRVHPEGQEVTVPVVD